MKETKISSKEAKSNHHNYSNKASKAPWVANINFTKEVRIVNLTSEVMVLVTRSQAIIYSALNRNLDKRN